VIPHSRPWLTDADKNAVQIVLNSNMIAKGISVKKTEEAISEYFGEGIVKLTSSGRHAIILALSILDVKSGDEVIIPSYVCESVAASVRAIGAIPVLADCGNNWVLSIESIEKLINENTKAIIAVNIFGIACDLSLMEQFGIPVIEDCAQSFGNRKFYSGSGKNISIYSFNATKCLTGGEGGAILVRDSDLKLKVDKHFKKLMLSSISDIQASLVLSQLGRYEQFLERRKYIAERYFSGINKNLLKIISRVKLNSIYFRFPLTVNKPIDKLIKGFSERNISVRHGVDSLLHRKSNLVDSKFENAVDRFNKTLSIPILPDLSEFEIEHIINVVNELCGEN